MILVDVNLLIYAINSNAPQHDAARIWLERSLTDVSRVGLPWASLLGFLRVATHPKLFSRPLATRVAWQQIEEWLASDVVWIPQPTTRHSHVFGRLLIDNNIYGSLVHDAHLAALAIEHGLTLCSTDGDFARFRELKWFNPLAP